MHPTTSIPGEPHKLGQKYSLQKKYDSAPSSEVSANEIVQAVMG